MTPRGTTLIAVVAGLVLVTAAAVGVAAALVGLERWRSRPATQPTDRPAGLIVPPDEPIHAEADPFRTRPEMLAIGAPNTPIRPANPRTLHRYRTRRAAPGAPPQIPHGLTAEEFRTGACNSCHQRGGYSPRFGAYVPVTPHPEMGACLQCHVGVDAITGIELPSYDPNAICRQCHDPNAPRALPPAAWSTVPWPALARRADDDPPPPIPHELETRTNCLACHAGPAAVPELRTSHPERASCRQCHVAVTSGASSAFVRETSPQPGATP